MEEDDGVMMVSSQWDNVANLRKAVHNMPRPSGVRQIELYYIMPFPDTQICEEVIDVDENE